MKNFLQFPVVLLAVLGIVSCEETTKEVSERSLIILVKDKSTSISQSKTEQEKETAHLKRYLNQHLSENTDVVVMDINSHSDSRTNTAWFEYKAPKVQESTRVKSKKQQELDQTLYQDKVRKTLKATQKRVIEAIYAESPSSNQTAIVELLNPMSEALKQYDKATICIYSDLIQESQFRDFTKGVWAMPSKSYATDLAQKDFKRLQKLGLHIDLGKVTSIDVVTPNNPQNEKYYVNMPFYWDELFSLGKFNGSVNWQKL